MITVSKKVNWRDVAERAVKTFVQAFVAVLIVADQPFSKEALVAGVAAGVSVTWNWFKQTV